MILSFSWFVAAAFVGLGLCVIVCVSGAFFPRGCVGCLLIFFLFDPIRLQSHVIGVDPQSTSNLTLKY